MKIIIERNFLHPTLLYFESCFNEQRIYLVEKSLDPILHQFTCLIPTTGNHKFEEINQIRNKSKILIIEQLDYKNKEYLIICFDNIIAIFLKSNINLLQISNKDITIISLSENINEYLNEYIHIDDKASKETIFLLKRIKSLESSNFLHNFQVKSPKDKDIKEIFFTTRYAIIIFLIKKSFQKIDNDRITNFYFNDQTNKQSEIQIKDNEYIKLMFLGYHNFSLQLHYHIIREELFVTKIFINENEKEKLFQREFKNYQIINHPFLPKFYGRSTIDFQECLVIEYIEGKTLDKIKEMNLTMNEKYKIIFEILIVFEYLHKNNLVYRDLKPNNLIVNKNKDIVLIDFDRMISVNDKINIEEKTIDFSHNYIAPEIKDKTSNKLYFETDIYSIGLIIYFIIFEKNPIDENNKPADFPHNEKLKKLKELYIRSTLSEPKKRISITELIDKFYVNYFIFVPFYKIKSLNNNELPYWVIIDEYDNNFYLEKYKITFLNNKFFDIPKKMLFYDFIAAEENHVIELFNVGYYYFTGIVFQKNITKAIYYLKRSADQNEVNSQYTLGFIYYSEVCDIDKAIYYFKLAAAQNHPESLYYLGNIFNDEENGYFDIDKSIYYYESSINKGCSKTFIKSHLNLGLIYYKKEFGHFNINKAIYHLDIAARNGELKAQEIIGDIYTDGKYIQNDIDRAIYYYSLASNNNSSYSQYILGNIYLDAKFGRQNIQKSIYYFTLSANLNNSKSQYHLGEIYFRKQFGHQDVKKAIYYLNLSASQNNTNSQNLLGFIYLNSDYVTRDLNKSIYYFTLAANKNDSNAQYYLGFIYANKIFGNLDYKKAFYYLTLSSNQNNSYAQFLLGGMYQKGLYTEKNISKAIHYYSLSSQKHNIYALYNLALLYFNGKEVTRDIKKTIHYLSLSLQISNFALAQTLLGIIYYEGIDVVQDINRSIYYFSLSASQNDPVAHFLLGNIYTNKKYGKYDIEKAIYHYKLASEQNEYDALFMLGLIYYQNKDIQKAIDYFEQASVYNYSSAMVYLYIIYLSNTYFDLNKALFYLKRAVNLNDSYAQYFLAILYLDGYLLKRDIKKAIDYLTLSANQDFQYAQFTLAYLLSNEIEVEQNIEKSIHYYKELSSFNNSYAKNNLALIYKNGFGVDKNIEYSIILLKEAIKNKDPVSMYNLANIYFYDELKKDVNEAINLLINSIFLNFKQSKKLLSVIFIHLKLVKFDDILYELKKFEEKCNDLALDIYQMILQSISLINIDQYEYVYNEHFLPIISSKKIKVIKPKQNLKSTYDITKDFYDGFYV